MFTRILESLWNAPVLIRVVALALWIGVGILALFPPAWLRSLIHSVVPAAETKATIEPPPPVASSVAIGGSVANSNVISAGRDVNVVVERRGPPSPVELRQDVTIEKKIRVSFTQATPAPHYAAIRISARELEHPDFYVKIRATKPLKDSFIFEVQNFPGGMRQMIASAVYGSTVEHTEAAPGLQPNRPWVLAVFADEPVEIAEVVTEDKCLFDDVMYRGWLADVEHKLSGGSANAITIGPEQREWAVRAVREGRLAWSDFRNTLTLPERAPR